MSHGTVSGIYFDRIPTTVDGMETAEFVLPDGTPIVGDQSAPHHHGAIGHNMGYGFFEDAVMEAEREWREEGGGYDFLQSLERNWDEEEKGRPFSDDDDEVEEALREQQDYYENSQEQTMAIESIVCKKFINETGSIRHATVQSAYGYKTCDVFVEAGRRGVTLAQCKTIAEMINRMLEGYCDAVDFLAETPKGAKKEEVFRKTNANAILRIFEEAGACTCVEGFEPCGKDCES